MPPDTDNTSAAPWLIRSGDSTAARSSALVVPRDCAALPSAEELLVPAEFWLSLPASSRPGGVWVDSDQSSEMLAGELDNITVLAINFPVFSDGRGYSIAHSLRHSLSYSGELRAIGDILPDQMLYLQRCGFTSFELRADKDPEVAIEQLGRFTEFYQPGANQPLPLFARRGAG